MPRANRVSPTGAFLAVPDHGAFMGNRGVLHDADGRLGPARWRRRAWVCCRLDFRGRRRAIMAPGRYTELFFLDEATALAAGHRPCAECRRADFERFRRALAQATGEAPLAAPLLDRRLHVERAVPGGRRLRRHSHPASSLPDEAMILLDGEAWRVFEGALRLWTPAGYGGRRALPPGDAEVLTPPTTLLALAAGYRPLATPDG